MKRLPMLGTTILLIVTLIGLSFPRTVQAIPQYQITIKPGGIQFVLGMGEPEAMEVNVFTVVIPDDGAVLSTHLETPVKPWQTGAMGTAWSRFNWCQAQVVVTVIFYRQADHRPLWHYDYGPYAYDRCAGNTIVLPEDELLPSILPREIDPEKPLGENLLLPFRPNQ